MRRWPIIPTAECFAILLRGNDSRWERCLHAGGAVVQFCRQFIVCWPQCSSMGSFCGTAVQSDPLPAPLFAHFFWQDRRNQIANQRSVCNLERTSNGTDETCRLRRGEECGVCEDEPPEARLRPCRKRGNPANPDRRADRIVRPYILSRAGKEIGVKCSPRLRRELASSVPAEKLPALFFTIYNIESFQPLW